jgi:hypothetical protein
MLATAGLGPRLTSPAPARPALGPPPTLIVIPNREVSMGQYDYLVTELRCPHRASG